MPARQAERRAPTSSLRCPAGRPAGMRLVVQPIAQMRRASDRGARETPSAAGRPTPSSTSPCVPRRRRSARSSRESLTPDEHRRNEVGQLDPARRGVEHVRRDLQAAPDLRPPPLGRIGAADRRQQLRRVRARGLGDRGRLAPPTCGPSTATRAPRGCPATSDRAPAAAPARRRGSGVDPVVSTPMPITRSRAERRVGVRLRQRAADRDAQPVDVVGGILPRQVRLLRIEQHALLAARIVEHARADDASVRRYRRRRREPSSSRSRSRSCTGSRVSTPNSAIPVPINAQRISRRTPKMQDRKTPQLWKFGVLAHWALRSCEVVELSSSPHPTSTGDTTSRTSGPVPARRALSSCGCSAQMRTAFSARLAKLIMLRSIARVGSSR